MRIALLARDENSPTTRMLRDTAHRLELDLVTLPVESLRAEVTADGTRVLHRDRALDPADFAWIWPRLGPLTRSAGLDLLVAMEAARFNLIQSAASVELASDKMRSLLRMREQGLRVPSTRFFFPWTRLAPEDLNDGPRFWIKSRTGSQGIGVSWAESPEQALAQADLIRMHQGSGLIQNHVEGEEVRVIVLDDAVLGAMKREPLSGNPRGNLAQGALARPLTASSEIIDLAVRATRSLGLRTAGVDLILSREGPVVLEANPSPGLTGISEITGRDLSTQLLQTFRKSSREQISRR